MTLSQFLKIAVWSNLLLLAGAPLANQLLFMTAVRRAGGGVLTLNQPRKETVEAGGVCKVNSID